VTEFGSPVRTITTRRDPRLAHRAIIRLDLLVPCATSLQRTGDGARWRIDEEAAW